MLDCKIIVGDCIEKMREMDAKCVDLVFGSPPYCDARTYGIGAQRGCDEWVEWMLEVTTAALSVSHGPVIWVAAGVTRDRNYWPACEGLMYRWWQEGGSMYRPCYWHRVGIFGSGGDQHFRADVEYIMCFKRAGKLPWTNNTACGHAPKWGPGGESSHRVSDGTRVNQWGKCGSRTGTAATGNKEKVTAGKARPSHYGTTRRDRNGNRDKRDYMPPAIANPGNWIDFPADVDVKVGGGHMGHALAHENEAPFPEKLAKRFVLSFCPPGGIVLDPFMGSGTTLAVAIANGRKAIGIDIRESQRELAERRIGDKQLSLLGTID